MKRYVIALLLTLVGLCQSAFANTLVFNPLTVVGGNGTTATLTVAGSPSGSNRTFLFSSSTPSVQVPSSVILLAGTLVVNFSVTTSAVSTPVQATITETAPNGTHVYGYLPVLANPLSSVTVSPNPVSGGTSTTGTVTLGDNAPTGGATVNLTSSNTAAATVPSTVTVPQGSNSATFTVSTSSVTSNATSTITASVGGSSVTSSLTVEPVLASISLLSSSVMGGTSTVGTLQLSTAAGPSGYAVSLSSNSKYAVVPPTVTVPSGATSVQIPIWTSPCSVGQSAVISASASGTTQTANLSLTTYSASVYAVHVPSTYVVGGGSTTVGVELDHYVTNPSGESVSLSTANADGSTPTAATVPSSVTVPFGANGVSFSVTTSTVASTTGVFIIATDGGTQEGLVEVMPSGGLGLSLSCTPSGIFGGNSATGTVTLSATQGAATVVSLSSGNTAVTVPSSVTVPSGSTTATFTVTTSATASSTNVLNGGWTWLAASTGASSASTTIAVYPAQLHAISATPSSLAGGASSTGTVSISGAAPSGGISVTLVSSDPIATIPAQVTIAAGSSTATFPITTASTTSPVYVTLSASYAGQTRACGFSVGTSVYLRSVSASPGSLIGGASSTGTVTLTAAAPAGGAIVTLNSTNAAAQVPASVTVPAGSSSATFTVTTDAVSSTKLLTLTGSLSGVVKGCGLIIAASSLTGLSVTSSTVTGGTSVTVTATLNGPAPTGGTVVTLASNSASATVPPTVTIPEGQTSTTFTVNTTAVTSATPVTITGVKGQTIHLGLKLMPSG